MWPWRLRCKCGHLWEAHEHYRSGTDCALCADCPQWRPVRLAHVSPVTVLCAWWCLGSATGTILVYPYALALRWWTA